MKTIFNICPYIYYRNEQFMKDCILIPYAFYKTYGLQATIVTAQKEEYTYLKLLPGLVTEIVPPTETLKQWGDFACDYIINNYHKIDILFCFGSYDTNCRIISEYKRLRSDGKVILKLDMNSNWADKLDLNRVELRKMYENCELITCESKRVKKFLSRKWPYKIEYVVNGYLEGIFHYFRAVYEEKEDIILTVGRIGIKEKANHILVEAFIKCANKFPQWNLRLVGSVEPSFQEYMKQIYTKYPEMRDRIQLTGKITDKERLNEEYKRAKIFALTSVGEGGTPNVFAEAALNGCFMVTSDIDAADEFTNWGKCGRRFPVNDVEGLVEIFEEILNDDFKPILNQSFYEIQEYCRRYFNYTIIVRKLMHLLKLKEIENSIVNDKEI